MRSKTIICIYFLYVYFLSSGSHGAPVSYGAPALQVGPRPITRPANAIDVTPGTDLSVLISGQTNKVYWLKAGLHTTKGQTVYPGDNTSILGEYLGSGEGQQALVSGLNSLTAWSYYTTVPGVCQEFYQLYIIIFFSLFMQLILHAHPVTLDQGVESFGPSDSAAKRI